MNERTKGSALMIINQRSKIACKCTCLYILYPTVTSTQHTSENTLCSQNQITVQTYSSMWTPFLKGIVQRILRGVNNKLK
jgi:hypothetical protein